jgi:uncharacterized glyoxalase superfamily protein PhnB
MFVSRDLKETKAFYGRAGFSVRFDQPEYLQVCHGGPSGQELCFMTPEAAPKLPGFEAFAGQGAVVSIPTKSADDKCTELEKAGVEILAPVSDKPWGWRSFMVADPNGVILDFFHVYKELPAGA